MSQSVGVLPSARPFKDWLLVTDTIRERTGKPESSVAVTISWMGTILWFGGQSTPLLGRMLTITGGSSRLTVTVNVPVATFPSSSVAVHETGVVPNGNVEPEAGLHTTVGTPQLSVAVTVKLTTA